MLARTSPRVASRFLRPNSPLAWTGGGTTTSGARREASVLVVSDPLAPDGSLPVATLSTVTAALQWINKVGDTDNQCILLTTGGQAPSVLPQGVTHAVHATADDENVTRLVEPTANTIQAAAADKAPDMIMGSATKWGSSVMPRAAALLQTSPLSDVVAIESKSEYGVIAVVDGRIQTCIHASMHNCMHNCIHCPAILTHPHLMFPHQTHLFAPCTPAMPWPRYKRPSKAPPS